MFFYKATWVKNKGLYLEFISLKPSETEGTPVKYNFCREVTAGHLLLQDY